MADSILPLELDAVSYRVRDQLLVDAVSTRFETGTRSVILGPNGAGKSLTLRMAHGLIEPSAGQVRWCGPAAKQARRRQVPPRGWRADPQPDQAADPRDLPPPPAVAAARHRRHGLGPTGGRRGPLSLPPAGGGPARYDHAGPGAAPPASEAP